MKSSATQFEFTGAVFKEGRWFVSLCLDVDVASQGKTIREAKEMLAEAVSLYLEVCLESNLPYLRPVPREEDPRFQVREDLVETFPLVVKRVFGVPRCRKPVILSEAKNLSSRCGREQRGILRFAQNDERLGRARISSSSLSLLK